MPRREHQKARILVLLRYLLKYTDQDHPVSAERIREALSREGIPADRKTIYRDIGLLNELGYDIACSRRRPRGFYAGGRDFQPAELKILVDAVQCGKFLTERKSRELIGKLETLTSLHEARSLRRQVFVGRRIKSMNESIYYNVDAVHSAIASGRSVTFRYFDWDLGHRRAYRRGGALYEVSPWALLWEDETYYLVGFDHRSGGRRSYRVDRMDRIGVTDVPRKGAELFRDFDPAGYSRTVFGMFGGDPVRIRMSFPNRMANLVFDRFGRDLMLFPDREGERFSCSADVVPSPQFYGRAAGLGPEARLLSPEPVVREFRESLRAILRCYGTG